MQGPLVVTGPTHGTKGNDAMKASFIDRTGWSDGPWDTEPDRFEWYDGDLPCLALRNRLGAWCGYVAVPPGHPWHGISYMECTKGHGPDCYEHSIPAEVHGGLTFADFCQPHDDETAAEAICHVPRPGEPDDVWWLGFDTAHCWDLVPGMAALDLKLGITSGPIGGTYRTLDYVRAEVASLASQVRSEAAQ